MHDLARALRDFKGWTQEVGECMYCRLRITRDAPDSKGRRSHKLWAHRPVEDARRTLEYERLVCPTSPTYRHISKDEAR